MPAVIPIILSLNRVPLSYLTSGPHQSGSPPTLSCQDRCAPLLYLGLHLYVFAIMQRSCLTNPRELQGRTTAIPSLPSPPLSKPHPPIVMSFPLYSLPCSTLTYTWTPPTGLLTHSFTHPKTHSYSGNHSYSHPNTAAAQAVVRRASTSVGTEARHSDRGATLRAWVRRAGMRTWRTTSLPPATGTGAGARRRYADSSRDSHLSIVYPCAIG